MTLKLFVLYDNLFCYKAFFFAETLDEAKKQANKNTISGTNWTSYRIKPGYITDAGGNG